MKFSTQEEYGLRFLLRIGLNKSQAGLTIPEIAHAEKLSQANTAKILRTLRMTGFIESVRGQSGGYKLSKPPEEIILSDVLNLLGGRLFASSFCTDHSGFDPICTHSIDCSIRSLWKTVQTVVDGVLTKTTLKDLMGSESQFNEIGTTLGLDVLANYKKNDSVVT
ncbi:MAG: transcriptional regulator [Chlorobiaceae bacterium]|nr:transcriptional regulator [Chlorobiaceae bacterium]MBA4310547.1 transcriptional regulator [Chlorobiaceae bacterium]